MSGESRPDASNFRTWVLSQVPATVWTTDRNLVVTFLGGQTQASVGFDGRRLVGARLPALVSDGRHDHPILAAHRGALVGRVEPVCLEWGDHVFAGQVGPLRDPTGEIVGCVGCGQMRVRDVTVDALIGVKQSRLWPARRARRRSADLPTLLSRVVTDFGWDGATVWTVTGDDGLSRLASVGRTPGEGISEAHAWLAASTGVWQTDASGGWFRPIVSDHRQVGVLGVFGPGGDPHEDGSTTLLDALAMDLAQRLNPTPAPRRVASRPMLVVLAACLIPMPMVYSSCYLASDDASLATTRSVARRAAVTMPFSTAVADECPWPTSTRPATPSSGAPPYCA